MRTCVLQTRRVQKPIYAQIALTHVRALVHSEIGMYEQMCVTYAGCFGTRVLSLESICNANKLRSLVYFRL